MSLAYFLYVGGNSGDIDDREEYVEHVFAVLREISSELYYRSTPHHDAVCERKINILDRQVIGSFLTRPL